MPVNPLNSVFFISVPEGLEHSIDNFTIDSSILLPVELKPGETELDLGSITWEMIISGMLRVLTWDSENEHLDYYRKFVLQVKPNIESDLVTAGIEKAKQGEYELAEELFTTALAAVPGSTASLYNLAQIYETRARAYRELGEKDLEQEYLQKTLRAYHKVCAGAPEQAQILKSAAEFYLRIGDNENALNSFKALSDLEDSREIREAISELNMRKELDESFKAAYDAILQGKEDQAVKLIDDFLKVNDQTWTAWFLRGWALRRLGHFEEAIDNFQQALGLSGPQTDLYNELSICTMETGLLNESRHYLEKALEIEPDNVKIISNLGIVSLKEGNKKAAARFFSKVLELDPNDTIAGEYLAYLQE